MPHLFRLLVKGDAKVGSGVVAQDGKRSELTLCLGNGRCPLVGIGHIQVYEYGPTTGLRYLVHDGLAFFVVDVRYTDRRALGRE